ncbi:hypothetical protein N801_11905 [Knoellia aerolata DSM 18566]|uniref:Uncharacterized protein n=1 Tax=Knoellia aerolata DSM 18566 TaxID=1385519 RepID=A0A0A0K1G4_9MICO|nr:hypothetical protein N801_11905 [Knoellia aerolata DSM 18566]
MLLLAHGLVHLLYLFPDVAEFSTQRSWLVPEGARRPVSLALIAASIATSAMLALSVWGLPGLADAWPVWAVVAGTLSLLLLVAYWDTRLVVGVAIDAALIAAGIVQPAWLQDMLT